MNNDRFRSLLKNRNISLTTILTEIQEHNSQEIFHNRKSCSEYYRLFPLLKQFEGKFFQYCRMDLRTFQYIFDRVKIKLIKNHCNLHAKSNILPEERLVITLRYLATGITLTDLSLVFLMGISTVSQIIKETMDHLWRILCPLHMKIPTKNEFLKISNEFNSRWNFPHTIGAIDGRHIRIKKPDNGGTRYFNYKKFHSIVLQALVDAKYRFITIDVGGFGSQSDGGTFQASTLYKALKDNTIQVPDDDDLPNSGITLPYFFVGDGAYPLMANLMTPYRGKNLSNDQRNYNCRLSRARMVVECAFGIMSEKWRKFHSTMQEQPENVERIVKCACILHNVIIDLKESKADYIQNLLEEDVRRRQNELIPILNNNNENFVIGYGREVQEELKKYIADHPIE